MWSSVAFQRQETLLLQRDRATRYVSQNLVNCRNKMCNKSAKNRMELKGYSWPIYKQSRLVDCRIGVVNKLDRWRRRRRALLTTRSTCRGEIFQDTLLLHITNMAYLFVPFPMTLDDLEGHSPNAGLIKCNSTNICATCSTVLSDTARRVVPRR